MEEVAKYKSCHLIWCEGSEGGKVEQVSESLEFISEPFEDHLSGWAVAYNVEFVPEYCCACSKAVWAHSVL